MRAREKASTMSHPIDYHIEQLDDQSMGSQSNDTPVVAHVVPYAVEEPGTSLMPQEVHPPQEALFGDRRIFDHVRSSIGMTTARELWMQIEMPGTRSWNWQTVCMSLVAGQNSMTWSYGDGCRMY